MHVAERMALCKNKMNVTKYLEQEVFFMGRAVLESKLKIWHGPPTTLGHLHQRRHRMLPFKNTQEIKACLQFRWSKYAAVPDISLIGGFEMELLNFLAPGASPSLTRPDKTKHNKARAFYV